MKIAIIGDIHANLPALEAVIEHAKSQSINEIWNVGDSVGYGAYPDQVIKLLQKEEILSILGNYDQKVLNFPKNEKKYKRGKKNEKYIAFKWAYENLSKKSIKYLSELPENRFVIRNGKHIYLSHGSPFSNEELITPETPDTRLLEIAKKANSSIPDGRSVDIMIFGHSHQNFARQFEDIWFINCGSVGRPDDGDPRASYALLELKSSSISVALYRVIYDVQRAVLAIHQQNLPETFAKMIVYGRDLNTILKMEI